MEQLVNPDRGFRRPESALVLIVAGDHTLLLERADVPGFWQSVTGSLEWDEIPAQTARRELREETGIDAVPQATGVTRRFEIMDVFAPRYAPGTTTNLEHEFIVQLPERVAPRLVPAEHVRWAWMPISEAIDRVTSWTNRDALTAIFRRLPETSVNPASAARWGE